MNSVYKAGTILEFTDDYHLDYTIGDKNLARYGLLNKDYDMDAREYEVILADKTVITIPRNRIQAIAWIGWMPMELERLYEEKFAVNDWDDY